ncbi:MAG: branched-chain amino acid ABC transporter permease [Deltaproteobacteria bacterium]|nr:MAG: branched-chain amino acid ABC transporter permease [Deltaproteobacteria bacterium]RPJ15343.1 MAG: branched-chain amino acid ABC transporter permease [Deltaproteobacteria bacterium]RPJ17721.1 MAG: branched-chain amino acid ABC transporter permease [Deltaproteobacteria bacterium]
MTDKRPATDKTERKPPLPKRLKDPYFWIFLIFLLYPTFPYFGRFMSLGTELLIWFIFTLSFNLCLGYAGLPSFGHGAFYGVGTYAAGLVFLHVFQESGFLIPIASGAVIGALFAGVLGFIIRNKKGIYFAMLTVVFTQVLYFICWRWDDVTGGESGLKGIVRTSFLGLDMTDPVIFYYFVFVVFVLAAIVIRRVADSSFGMSLQAIKQNPIRSQYLGYNTGLYRFLVYLISGFFAGLSGALYCFLTQSAFASVLDWTKSGDVVIATLLGGGTVSFYGPIVGTIIFIISQEVISSFWEHWMLLYGLSFVVIILAFPTGLLGMLKKK